MPAATNYGPYPLTKDYRVSADRHCYMLHKRIVIQNGENTGEVEWRIRGYYGTIQQLLNKLLSLHIAENLGDLGEAIECMREVEKNLENLLTIKYEREKSWMS